MARQKEKIYRRRRPVRALLRTLGFSVLALAVLLVVVFFQFQRYIVYTPDGIRLDIPFLRGILDDIPEDASPYPILPPAEAETPADTVEAYVPDVSVTAEPLYTVWLSGAQLADVPDWEAALYGFGANAVLVSMNDASGALWWDSAVTLATSYALTGEGDPRPVLEAMGADTQRAALLYGFQNRLMAQRNPPVALTEDRLDPESAEVQAYLTDLALELVQLGFDEIVLMDFAYPPGPGASAEAIPLDFLSELANALSAAGAELSLMTREADWLDPEESENDASPLRPDFRRLSAIVSRFYCLLEPETLTDEARLAALDASVQAILGHAELYRFVPGGPGFRPQAGSWMMVPRGDELS